jgi:hypothetical protein
VVKPQLGDERLAGLLKPPGVGRAGIAPVVIGVDRGEAAGGTRISGDAADLIGERIERGGKITAFVPDQRIVGLCPMEIAPQQAAAVTILGNEFVAVVQETRRRGQCLGPLQQRESLDELER